MNINDITLHQVPSVNAKDTLYDAAILMQQTKIGLLPVIEDGRLVGTLSEGEIMQNSTIPYADPRKASVSDIYNRNPIVCGQHVHLKSALRLMQQHRQSGIAVVDDGGGVIGVVTPLQLVELLLNLVPEERDIPELEFVHRVRGDQKLSP